MWTFSWFLEWFRSSQLIVDLLKVVFDRITRASNRSGATRAVALDISKTFDRVWHAGLLQNCKSYRISGQIFGLISSFFSNGWLWMVPDRKSSLEYPVNAVVPQGSILGPTLFLLLMTFLVMLSVIFLSVRMVLLSTLSVFRHLTCGDN